MVTRRFQTEGLDGLCSERQLELLNAIDSLRSQGISYYISLPQIIVCGDQSSGKSSILEALSGVSFPVKGNLCTRFPTELVLRKAPYESVKVTIVPDQSRSKPEQEQLATFHVELEGLQQLSKLIEEAKNAMGISPHVRAFAKDLLKVEISGPSQPHLTIVDLPGLIHTETKYQTASEVQLVHELVQSYMNERRSIILAVVSAKNDHANQIVLKLARQADPKGMRTIGVITKPDTLVPGSATEGAYLCLANNQDVEFRLGWHALKNMDTDAGLVSLEERNVAEEIFFSEGSWKNLPDHLKGVKKLRERLSKELLKQIAIELPNLLKEIDKKIEHNRQELNRLGEPRASIQEQRLYLVRVSQNFQALVNSASSGVYNDEFFGDAKTIVGYQKRIRAVIQNLNDDFAKDMSIEGQAYTIVDDDKGIDEKKIRRKDYLTSVQNLMRRTRGCELPGTFNPMIVMNLFLEQSTPWERIAMKHVGGICEAVKQFAAHICDRISDEATSKRLYLEVVEPALLSYFEILKRKTMELLVPHQKGHPITYNHYLTENLQKARGVRQKDNLEKSLNSFFSSEQESAGGLINPRFKIGNLLSRLCDSHEQDMVNFSCIEALDCMKAYYKVCICFVPTDKKNSKPALRLHSNASLTT